MRARMSAPNEFSLPLPLAEGLVLSGIQLDCLACHRPFRLTHGHGCASPIPARIALAARAACPACTTPIHFLIVVDSARGSARVQRVSRLGLWLVQRLISLRRPETGALVPSLQPVPPPEPVWSSIMDLELADESLGRFQGTDIPAWIALDGQRYPFAGIAPQNRSEAQQSPDGTVVIPPGLLYRPPLDVLL